MIGVGVTTYKRPDMRAKCFDQIVKHLPDEGMQVHFHDDSETELGIAASKNACIANLMGFPDVEHIFLFDDDTYPTKDEWWKPYVESDKEHLAYIWLPRWDKRRECWPVSDGTHDYIGWNTSNGCMLYYTRHALETVGGMRPQFGKWGFEHLEHSHRIYRAGLTPEPFISLSDQHGIYATDEHDEDFKESSSSITPAERREWRARNLDLYRYWIEQEPEFVPWD